MYRLIGWVPPLEPGQHGYSFGLRLDSEFALRAATFIRQDDDFIQKRIREMLKPIDMDDYPSRSVLFWGCSILATNFTVAGNACGLDVCYSNKVEELFSPDSYRTYLEYDTHNCDSMKQAYSLLSAFQMWYDWAEAIMYY